jgi:hypothetical protein
MVAMAKTVERILDAILLGFDGVEYENGCDEGLNWAVELVRKKINDRARPLYRISEIQILDEWSLIRQLSQPLSREHYSIPRSPKECH